MIPAPRRSLPRLDRFLSRPVDAPPLPPRRSLQALALWTPWARGPPLWLLPRLHQLLWRTCRRAALPPALRVWVSRSLPRLLRFPHFLELLPALLHRMRVASLLGPLDPRLLPAFPLHRPQLAAGP